MRSHGLRSAIPVGLIPALALLVTAGCFRSPRLSQITCTDKSNCPSGYSCLRPGEPGGCIKTVDAGSGDALGDRPDRLPSLDLVGAVDGQDTADTVSHADARMDASPVTETGPASVDSNKVVPEIDTALPDGAGDLPALATDALALGDGAPDTPVDPRIPDAAQLDARPDLSRDLTPDQPQTSPDTGGSSGSGGNSSGGATGSGGAIGGTTDSGGATGGTTGSGGVTGGGTTVTGGVNSGGTTAAGGSTATNSSLACNDAVYGAVSIPASAVISDFENGSLKPYPSEGRAQGDVGGWRGWADADAYNPESSPNVFAIDTSVHGPCSTKGALHVTSTGPDMQNAYVAFGVDVMGRNTDRKKQSWDASKYTGVGFWAKCASDLPFAFLRLVDANTEGDMPNPTCSYTSSPRCVQHGVKNAVITKEWTYHKLYFNEVLQDPTGDPNGAFTPRDFDPKKFVAFQIYVNAFTTHAGSPRANNFDCHIDDLHFLGEAAPTTPTAAVTWSVSGTIIRRNGINHKIRGLGRPSMEWDYAGWGITREDAQRMKSWKANTVRLAVKDTLWNGAPTGSANGNGPSYQLHVKRAVSWYLQQGMDVILDLHYVGGSPSSAHASFWDAISKAAFFQDRRIIYELFNEPTDGVDALRTWGNAVISKIRSNGANNLILMSGPDWTYDLSGYVGDGNGVTDSASSTAYVVHPYIFKPSPDAWKSYCAQLPVVATEFGDANLDSHRIVPEQCVASIYSNYISAFEQIGMSWTSTAWIVDEWGCGFPQLITDWSGTPNAIGTPVRNQLSALNP